MSEDISSVLTNMKTNIERCEILSNILEQKLKSEVFDMGAYMRKGYSEEEICIGMEIIDLYIEFLSLVEKHKLVI